jgi:hypothetical protein
MVANSNTQVISSLSLIRAFGFRKLNFLDNGPNFCNPNCDHRSWQATQEGSFMSEVSRLPKDKQPQRRGGTREMKADVQQ